MKIKFEEYNTEWEKWFLELKEKIYPLVEHWILSFQHVGSTSIKGMGAKPIIDIDMVVKNFDDLQAINGALESLGYSHQGNQGIKDREAYKLNYESDIPHHLYLVKEDSIAYRNHTFLKKHLEENESALNKYLTLKRELAMSKDSRVDYWLAKTNMILSFLEREGMCKEDVEQIRKENE